MLYINRNQCEIANDGKGVPIEFTLTSLSSYISAGARVLEVWVGQTDSNDCHGGADRERLNVSGDHKTVCYKVGDPITNIDTAEQIVEINARSLFSSDSADEDVGCDLQNSHSVWIVPLANQTPDVGNPADGIGAAIEIKFVVDVTPLDAPDAVKGGSGESEVRLRWSAPSGADSLTRYEVYYDMTAISEGTEDECSSELLVPGAAPKSADESDLVRHNVGHGTSAVVDPASLGLSLGEEVPAAVLAIDGAGNRSVASNVVCVRRTETIGFWEACDAESDCRESFHSCSISHARRRDVWTWPLGLVGITFWLWRRSERRQD